MEMARRFLLHGFRYELQEDGCYLTGGEMRLFLLAKGRRSRLDRVSLFAPRTPHPRSTGRLLDGTRGLF